MTSNSSPQIRVTDYSIALTGDWNRAAFSREGDLARIRQALGLTSSGTFDWDLTGIATFDYFGAQLLWRAWQFKLPKDAKLTPVQQRMFARLASTSLDVNLEDRSSGFSFTNAVSALPNMLIGTFMAGTLLIGQLLIDLLTFLRNPFKGPWKEISANIYRAGLQAMPITAVVAFLIGVVLSYLTAEQLHVFGGDVFLVNLLGMSIVRELGPLLAAILVAGRSGSAMTAQIGVMRLTEELNAMQVIGLPHGFRLILPKVLGLMFVMPLLVVWTDLVSLIGGMLSAKLKIDLSIGYFLQALPEAVPIANYWLGLGKGIVFGMLISMIACHYGFKIKPDTESLGRETTASVVTSITVVILADAVFAIVFSGVGF